MNKMTRCLSVMFCECLLTHAAWVQASESWVTGRVVDERGKPVAGAKVYVAATYYGGIRMYEAAAMARTDAQGRYNVTGADDLANLPALSSWPKRGIARPWDGPVFHHATFKIKGQPEPKRPPAPVCDFALTSHGGSLDVVATINGRPAVGITVELQGAGRRIAGDMGPRERQYRAGGSRGDSLYHPARPTKPASPTSSC